MDITAPQFEEEPAPDPQRAVEQNIDKVAIVRQIMEKNPDASPDEIVEQLGARGLSVSGVHVASLIQKMALLKKWKREQPQSTCPRERSLK